MRKIDEQPNKAQGILPKTYESPSSAEREAYSTKDVKSESDTDLQQTASQFKPPNPTVSSRKKKNSSLRKTDDLPSQAQSLLPKTSDAPSSVEREANSTKDVQSECGTEMQQTVTQLKPPDPTVLSTRKRKSSGLRTTYESRQAQGLLPKTS